MIRYLTRSGDLNGTMPRLYVSCHPEDFEQHFRTICSDIFAVQKNCAIFYEDDPAAPYDETELFSLLGDMRLIAVPVTSCLLGGSSRALDVEIPFAAENSIIILPILAEPDESGGLIDAFNNNEVFGGMQFLNRYDNDPTALRYDDKLATFLSSVLVSEEEVKRIHDEFSSKIFLSYRKKDRKHAQELMRRIHRVDVCRDTAIWYDEYLIPGESFDQNIMSALDESDVFVMSVTSSFKEPGNYVADHEYPDAVRKNKPLVAADMRHFDSGSLDDLEEMYPGIKALMVDPDDADLLGVTMRQRLTEDAGIPEDELLNDDGEHLYYIALAYKNGIRTEADPEKAAGIFRMSAENGCCESWLRLIKMLRFGDGIAKGTDAALALCKEAEKKLKPLEGSSLRNDNALASVYEEEGHMHSGNDDEKAAAAFRAAYELRGRMQKMYEDASLQRYSESMTYLAALLFYSGMIAESRDIAEGFVEENRLLPDNSETADGETAEDIEMLRIRARIYNLLSNIYIQLRQRSGGIRYDKARVDICERIERATGDVDDLRELADACIDYADRIKNTNTSEANVYIDKYTEIRSRLAEFDGSGPKTISDAIDTFRIADNVLLRVYSGDRSAPEKAAAMYKEVIDICVGLMDGEDRYNAILLTANTYKRLGLMERNIKNLWREAMDSFMKALAICRDAEKEFRNDLRLMQMMSYILDQIGTIYLDVEDLSSATRYFTDALEVDMKTSRAAGDPASKHNLAKSYMRIADINMERGHQPVADVNNRSALKILEPLAQETDDYMIFEDLALAYFRLGDSERLSPEKRMEYYEKASQTYEYLMEITNDAEEYVKAHASVQEHKKTVS